MDPIKVDIYRSSKRDEMYAYLQRQAERTEPILPSDVLPPLMLKAFGHPHYVMTIDLAPERKLARANTAQVLQALADKGFFIQMPPDGLINPAAPEPEGLKGA